MSSPLSRDAQLLRMLRERDSGETVVVLRDGRGLAVHNIAWGYDVGGEWAHVTSNISPSVAGASADFFSTSEVASMIDPITNCFIYTTKFLRLAVPVT